MKKMKKTLQIIKKVGIYSAFFGTGVMSAQTTYTFTNASATGSVGPTSPQVSAAYLLTNLNGSVTVTSGIQNFTVPVSGNYRIEAMGAQGFGTNAGKGAAIAGNFTLTAGTVIKILVGQQGASPISPGTNQYGGGGGSFVTDLLNNPYVVAGGGGGSWALTFTGLSDGTVSINGNSGANGPTNGAGGISGNGGGTAGSADGGGGITGNGLGTTGGLAFINGGLGGAQYGHGGFGGGAGASSWNNRRGGGGGGYSGGGGAGSTTSGYPEGGGGGSFNAGLNQINNSGINISDGKVIITYLFGVNIAQTSTIACNGLLTAALSASVSGGTGPYTYSWSPSGGTASTATGLGAGTYTCLVSSAVSGTTSGVFTVTQPSAVVSAVASKTNVSCYGGANGVITLTTTGGTAPYSYSWTPTGGSAASASGLVAGTYSCTVKDANLCSASISTTITQPATFSVATSNSIICVGSTASLTATGATSYTWNTAATTSVIAVSPTVTTTYTVTGVTGVCSNSLTITQNVSLCTGVNEVLGNLVTIYPNPNNGVFTIELNATTQVSITTILGDVLLNTTLNTGKQTLDIQNRANGIYFVKLIQNGKQQTIKLIKE